LPAKSLISPTYGKDMLLLQSQFWDGKMPCRAMQKDSTR
jgi:hypothetical protein